MAATGTSLTWKKVKTAEKQLLSRNPTAVCQEEPRGDSKHFDATQKLALDVSDIREQGMLYNHWDVVQVQKGCCCTLQRRYPRNAAPSTSREPMKFVSHKMYVMDHMKQGSDLHMLTS